MDYKKFQKSSEKYICKKCDYCTSRLSQYTRHISTPKHQNTPGELQKFQKSSESSASEQFICKCGKHYKHRQGLWKHHKKCNFCGFENDTKYIQDEPSTPELIALITQLVKGQNGLQDSILEICKNGTHNTTNSNNNSNNKSFNLQFFLNETCKDAMNIMDFVDSIKLQLSDLENVGEMGYVKGISNIIVKNLNALDITQRPVHCADKKREVLYVKDDNKWEKENGENEKLRKMIKRVAFKNYKQITQFKAKYPDCNTSESKYSDKYNKIIIESMGGAGDNERENEDKIIKNITKEVVINKEDL
jgi:hypothetical protein